MKFKVLNAVLRLYESNMRNLHWNSAGEEFNDSHKSITEEYYELLAETVDKISEIMAIFEINAPNYVEVLMIIKQCEKSFLVVESTKLYSRADVVRLIDVMFKDIIELIVDVLEDYTFENPANAGVKSELENILYTFTFQQKYINGRKLVQV